MSFIINRYAFIRIACVSLVLCACVGTTKGQEPAPAIEPIKHQITGLFMKDRIEDLQQTAKKLEGIELVSIATAGVGIGPVMITSMPMLVNPATSADSIM